MNVEIRVNIHVQNDSFPNGSLKAGRRGRQAVRPWRECTQQVPSCLVALGGIVVAFIDIRQFDVGCRHGRSRRICDQTR